MSKEKIIPESALPLTPSESPAGWKKLREALDKKDWDGARSALEAMALSPKLVPMLAAAVAEERELGEIEAAGVGQDKKFEELSAKLKYFLSVIPKSADDAEKTSDKIAELKTQCDAALVARDAARRAHRMREHLKNWIPQLWGLPTIDGEHSGHLSGGLLPPKTFKAASDIKGMRQIDLFVSNSWRDFDLPVGEQSRRKYSTFAPSNNPLFPQKGI
jgi:hypothetical protein